MENIINAITGNTYLLIGVIIVLLLLVFSFVKKLFKLALVLVVVVVAYALYLNFTGQDVEKEFKKTFDKATEVTKDASKKAGELLDNDAVKETVDKASKMLKKK